MAGAMIAAKAATSAVKHTSNLSPTATWRGKSGSPIRRVVRDGKTKPSGALIIRRKLAGPKTAV